MRTQPPELPVFRDVIEDLRAVVGVCGPILPPRARPDRVSNSPSITLPNFAQNRSVRSVNRQTISRIRPHLLPPM